MQVVRSKYNLVNTIHVIHKTRRYLKKEAIPNRGNALLFAITETFERGRQICKQEGLF